jgi:hypothetical protein
MYLKVLECTSAVIGNAEGTTAMAIEVGELTGEPAIVVWPVTDDTTGERYWTWRIVTTALLSQCGARHPTPQSAFAEAMNNVNKHIEEHNLKLRKLS